MGNKNTCSQPTESEVKSSAKGINDKKASITGDEGS